MFRAALTVLVTAALGLLTLSVAPPAQATVTGEKCADNTGLNVVIDFQELGGGVQVKCVEDWSGGKALKGLDEAFKLEGTDRWGLAFICRVEGKPGPNVEDCIDTPPAEAHWAYWSSTSGSWSQSGSGVANSSAKPGEWHGLSFSKNRTPTTNPPPRVPPTVPRAPKPKPKPTTPSNPPTTSSPAPTSPGTSTGKPKPKPKPKPESSATGSAKPSAPSTSDNKSAPSATQSEQPSPSETPGEPAVDDEKETPDETESPALDSSDEVAPTGDPDESTPAANKTQAENGGPPVGTLIALGAVLLIGAAAIVRHRVRTNPGQSSNNSESN